MGNCCATGIMQAKNHPTKKTIAHKKQTSLSSEKSSSESSSTSSKSDSNEFENENENNEIFFQHSPMGNAAALQFSESKISAISNAIFNNDIISNQTQTHKNTDTMISYDDDNINTNDNKTPTNLEGFNENNKPINLTQTTSTPMVKSRVVKSRVSKHESRHSIVNTINNNITIQSKININNNNVDNSFNNQPINIDKQFNNNNIKLNTLTPKSVVKHELIDDNSISETQKRVQHLSMTITKSGNNDDDDQQPPLIKGYSTLNEVQNTDDDDESSDLDENERLEILKAKDKERRKTLKKNPTLADKIINESESEDDNAYESETNNIANQAANISLGDLSELPTNHGDLFRDQSAAHWSTKELAKKQREMAEEILKLSTQNEQSDMTAQMQILQQQIMSQQNNNNNNDNNNDNNDNDKQSKSNTLEIPKK